MEPIRVDLRNWPLDGIVTGWVVPEGKTLAHWTVTRVHAAYRAAELRDGNGTVVRPELRAYLVDLSGRLGLPDLDRAFLYQVPQLRWMLRTPDEQYLSRREKYKVA